MGTPFVIVGTGQSNMHGMNAMSWSPNSRAKHWNNDIENESSIGNAFGPIPNNNMGIAWRYAHAIAQADANKDVYLARYAKGALDIQYWIGGSFYRYGSSGSGAVYTNNSPTTATQLIISRYDVYGVFRNRHAIGESVLRVGQHIWLYQGSSYYQYQVTGTPNYAGDPYIIPVTYVGGSGTLSNSDTQVSFAPRMLMLMENSIPVMLTAAGKSTIDILLWWQGESDAGSNSRYALEFNFIMSYLSGKSWWGPDTKIIICGVNWSPNNGLPESDAMNNLLAGLVTDGPNRYYCGTAQSLPANRWQDIYHMTAQGYMEAGDLLLSGVYAPPMVTPGGATYAIAPSATTVSEGASVTFTITTTGVGSTTLYWTNAGTTTGADFTDGQNSGTVTISNNSGLLSRSLVSDSVTEGGETVVIQLRTGSIGGPIVATATSVTIVDAGTPPAPGGGTITGITVGPTTVVMDVTSNPNHTGVGSGAELVSYGLWIDGCPNPYKDGSGNVYIPLPHSENYRFRIPNWNDPNGWELQATMNSPRDIVEGHYNNRHWIFGVWSTGSTIYGLAHHEWYKYNRIIGGYNGFNEREFTGLKNHDWVNSITHVVSTNGGATFSVTGTANNSTRCVLVPEPYSVQGTAPNLTLYGFFHPSNIVQEGSYYYACVEQRSKLSSNSGDELTGGVSLIRTTNVASPTGWEFWSGSSWVTVDHNFYQGNLSTQQPHRFFEMVNNYYTSAGYTSHMGQSLRYHTPTSQWLMFGFVGNIAGFFCYSRSPTLANPTFTAPVSINPPNPSDYDSGDYRVVFDEAAPGNNYVEIGNNLTVLTVENYVRIKKAQLTISVSGGGSGGATYAIDASTASVSEGNSVTYTVTTTGVGTATLYWTNAGSSQGSDFSDGLNSGTVSISSNIGYITRSTLNDGASEGNETLIIQIRTGSTSGPVVATASTVTIVDSGAPAITYSVHPSVMSSGEGAAVWFYVTTTNLGSGTLYWGLYGTVTSTDLIGGEMSGTVDIVGDTGSIPITIASDVLVEGSETMIMQIRTGSLAGPVVATSATVTIIDTPTTTYSVAPSVTEINEGNSVVYEVNTTNFAGGTLYWTNAGTSVAADFVDGVNSGTVIISSNYGTFTRTLKNDLQTEGSESIIIQLRQGSAVGTVVATAAPVTINDTSVPTGLTYNVSPSTLTMNEGDTVLMTITTTGFVSGTLYWTNAGTSGASDFTDGQNSGSVFVSNDIASFSRTLNNDLTAEGNETLIIQIRTGSTSGPVVATASTVTIVDTSQPAAGGSKLWFRNSANTGWLDASTVSGLRFRDPSNAGYIDKSGNLEGLAVRNKLDDGWITFVIAATPTYAITPNLSSVNEGSTVSFSVSTTALGTATLYWTNAGTTIGSDFSDGLNSGTISVVANAGTLDRTLLDDILTEGDETVIIQLRTGSTGGPIVATAAAVSVVDTSQPAVPYQLSLARNDLDFFYLPDHVPSDPGNSIDIRCSFTTTDFFSRTGGGISHMLIAFDCSGEQGSNNPHCGPIYRYGRNLWELGRGVIIDSTGTVYFERWNGTFSPVVTPINNTSGATFNPNSGTFTIRIRAGWTTSSVYASLMLVTICSGIGIYGPVVFQGTVSVTQTYTGTLRVAIGAIGNSFVPPSSTGCVETTAAGSSPTAVVPFSDFTVMSF